MKLLIFAPYGIGNLILLHPVLKALKEQNIPFDIVSFLGSVNYMLEKWPEFNTLYDRKWNLTGAKKEIFQNILKIRKEKYTTSILSFPSAKPHYNLLSFLCGAKNRYGSIYSDNNPKTLTFLNNHPIPVKNGIHDVYQNLDLFTEAGVAIDKSMLSPMNRQKQPSKTVGIHLGCSAGGAYKRWPLEKWDALVTHLYDEYRDYTIKLYFGPDEQEELLYFKENTKITTVTGLNLTELKEDIAECALFISNDSGLMHIAAFTGVPGIVVAGPSDETRTGPFSQRNEIVSGNCSIRPCSHSYTLKSHTFYCPYETRECLETVQVSTVFSKVQEFLSQ